MPKPARKTAQKVAVSIPDALFRAIETERVRSGLSRSAVVQEALQDWLYRGARAQLVREYEGGYRALPESEHEVTAALHAAAAAWGEDAEPW